MDIRTLCLSLLLITNQCYPSDNNIDDELGKQKIWDSLINASDNVKSDIHHTNDELEKQKIWNNLINPHKIEETFLENVDLNAEIPISNEFYNQITDSTESDKNINNGISEIKKSENVNGTQPKSGARIGRANDEYEESTLLLKDFDPNILGYFKSENRNVDNLILKQNKYGTKTIEDPDLSETMTKKPKPGQTTLVIVFDGTGSMLNDLHQLTIGAEAIVNEITQRSDNPIFNYVFVPFRDPYVGPKLVTENQTKLLNELRSVRLFGGGDCPESAVGGINFALESALPKSLVYVFTDATARDFGLDKATIDLIQEKQVTLTFLLTGFCGSKNTRGYYVYEQLAALSNGQVYNLQKTDIRDVLDSIKQSLDTNLVPLNYIYSNDSGSQSIEVAVDQNLKEFTVSVAGKSPNITVTDPNDVYYKEDKEILNLDNLKIVNVQDPQPGKWNVHTHADSEHSVRLTALSDLNFNVGFSLESPINIKETNLYPIKRVDNFISVSTSNDTLIHNLTTIQLVLLNSEDNPAFKNFEVSLPLKKIEVNSNKTTNSTIYVSKPFQPPLSLFKIYVNGFDLQGSPLKHLLSTAIKAIDGEIPRVSVVNDFIELTEGEDVLLECKVDTTIPTVVHWIINNNEIYDVDKKSDSGRYIYSLKNVQMENAGKYVCEAINVHGRNEKEINIIIKEKEKIPLYVKMMDPYMISTEKDVDYQISCFVIPYENVSLQWLINDKPINNDDMQVVDNNLVINKVNRIHTGNYTCMANNGRETKSDSAYLDVYFEPSILGPQTEKITTYFGDNVSLSCDAIGNPKPTISWTLIMISDAPEIRTVSGSIEEFSPKDEGLYLCEVSNNIGGVAQKEIYVEGRAGESPKIIKPNFTKIDLNVGENLTLRCECHLCGPITNYNWVKYRNFRFEDIKELSGNILYPENRQKNFSYSFDLRNISRKDLGIYQCELHNEHGFDKLIIELNVLESPIITMLTFENDTELPPDNIVKVSEGKTIEIICNVHGNPPPKIDWTKDNVPLLLTENIFVEKNRIFITGITVEDAGFYECQATNSLGRATRTFELLVVVPPNLVVPEDTVITVEKGQEVKIICEVTGIPQPKVSWFLNDRKIEESDEYYTVGNTSLQFIANFEDNGYYNCLAENDGGNVAKPFLVVVFVPPKIHNPNDETVNVKWYDKNVTLGCDAEGYPNPHISWRYNGNLIHSTEYLLIENGKLILKNVSQSSGGVYVCEVTNNFGETEKSFYLNVKELPHIVSKFNYKYTLRRNESLSLKCDATGNPPPEISWKKNSDLIEKESEMHILEVKNATLNMSDYYECVATNSVGTETKRFEIVVLDIPQLQSGVLNDLKIYAKETNFLKLLCPFTNMKNVSWYKDGVRFYHSSTELGSLMLPVVMLDDRGNYTCVAENEIGSRNYSQTVIVLAAPHIDPTLPDIESSIGENITIKCPVDGYPFPKITWKKNDVIISVETELNLTNVKEVHSGQYTCLAENSIGSNKFTYNLQVYAPPNTNMPPINWIESYEGDDLKLDCIIFGNPAPVITWKKNNVAVSKGDTVLYLNNLTETDRGTYSCTGENFKGLTSIEYRVDILGGPKFLSVQDHVSIVNREDLILKCIVKGNPLPILAWSFNGKILLGTSRIHNIGQDNENFEEIDIDKYGNVVSNFNKLNEIAIFNKNEDNNNSLYGKVHKTNDTVSFILFIKDEKKKLPGFYTCHAINSVGNNEIKTFVEIFVPPFLKGRKVDKDLFVNVTLLEGLPLILSCSWDGVPYPDIKWLKNDLVFGVDGHSLSYDKRILTIPITKISDSGNYSCRASNKIGSHERNFLVDILAPPTLKLGSILRNSINENLESENGEAYIDAVFGQKIVLECPVFGNPTPSVFWVEQLDENINNSEVLITDKPELVLNEIQSSGIYTCYANNTIGFIEKKYRVQVLKTPQIEENYPQNYIVKEYQTISLHCRMSGSPKPAIKWFKDGQEIKYVVDNVFLSQDQTNLKIANAKKIYTGIYTCRVENIVGVTERNFNITVTTPVKWSPWDSWTPCSQSCGKGMKTRFRRCVLLNGDVAEGDLNSCIGNNFETTMCDLLPCPIDGVWGGWSDWTTCSKPCWDGRDMLNPTRKRYRECNAPKSAYGGRSCLGKDVEEEPCNQHACPIDGGWSSWTAYSACSVSCGNGLSTRYRECNSPLPLHGGKICVGNALEYQICYTGPCPIDGGWSEWSLWSECSQTCGHGFKKRKRACINPEPKNGGSFCVGDNVEVIKCKIQKCKNSDLLRNMFPQHTFIHHSTQSNEDDFILDHTRQRFITGSRSNVDSKLNSNEENSDELDLIKIGTKVVVKVENLMPIESGVSEINFHPARAPLKLTRILPCTLGFENDVNNKCIDIDECKVLTICDASEVCINTIGSFYCSCRRGYALNQTNQKCEDIDECSDETLHGCSHQCKNTFGSYYCACPIGLTLSFDANTCVHDKDTFSTEDNVMSDHAMITDSEEKEQVGCPAGFCMANNDCLDINECEIMEDDCGFDQSCLNTNGSYLCLYTPCPEEYKRDKYSGQCVLMCNETICNEGAKISDTLSYTILTLNELKSSEAFLKVVNYDINRMPLSETIFSLEKGRYSNLFKLETLAFKKGIAYLYGSNRIKRKTLYNVTVNARSFDAISFQLLYFTKFVIYLYVL